jgi:hypothetical protein
MFRRVVLIGLLLGPGTLVFAAKHYVRAGAAGAGNGSDWTNAFGQLPPALVRSDTYYVADGDYPGYTFDDPESSDRYIYLIKATLTDHGVETGWDPGYGDGKARFTDVLIMNTGYWDIDGQVGKYKGVDEPYGFEIYRASNGEGVSTPDQLTSGYHRFAHIKIWVPAKDTYFGCAFDYTCTSGSPHHITISDCYILNFSLPFYFYNGNYITVERSVIQDNHSDAVNHSEGASIRYTNHVVFRYCWLENMEGTGGIMAMEGDEENWEIYGNVFYQTDDSTCDGVSQGVVGSYHTLGNSRIYNNTVVGVNAYGNRGASAGIRIVDGPNTFAYNNLWYNSRVFHDGSFTYDYNYYSNCVQDLYAFQPAAHEPPKDNTQLHSSINTDPFVNSAAQDFRLKAPLAGYAGLALSDTFQYDYTGAIRGADGVWDRGAFEFTATQVRSAKCELR